MTVFARLIAIALAFIAVPAAVPAAAQDGWVVTETIVTEEWVVVEESASASRYVSPLHAQAEDAAIAAYGPFRVLDGNTAALVDITQSNAPQAFAAMLDAYPTIAVLEFVEAPGTYDDRANLQLGRMIREAGLATRVSEGGSVRSGAVELFLAGETREIDRDAEFAVHGWLDDRGRGAEDFAPGAPEHRRYLDYYVEMGMAEDHAQAFYAMTNSVPFEQARWLTGSEMISWLAQGAKVAQTSSADAKPELAYVDLDLTRQ